MAAIPGPVVFFCGAPWLQSGRPFRSGDEQDVITEHQLRSDTPTAGRGEALAHRQATLVGTGFLCPSISNIGAQTLTFW